MEVHVGHQLLFDPKLIFMEKMYIRKSTNWEKKVQLNAELN